MKLPTLNRIPLWIATGVILLVCLLQLLRLDFVERIEAVTYDMRMRQALRHKPSVTNLFSFVFIDEQTLASVRSGRLGYRFGLYWPRQVYGRVLQELNAQGATAVALDVLFGELRPDHPPVQMSDGSLVESDDFFAQQLRLCSNSILAITHQVLPPELFRTNAAFTADISTDKDPDGILRRVRAFRAYRSWHQVFRQIEADPEYGVDLRKAFILDSKLHLPRSDGEPIVVPLDNLGRFEMADFVGSKLPPGLDPQAQPFSDVRVWHMGVALAAAELGLRLDQAEIDLDHGRIVLKGPGGVSRILPVDREGCFLVDWAITPNDPRLKTVPMQNLLEQHKMRMEGRADLPAEFKGKLVVVGSAAVTGNDLTDRGATPISPDTLLVAKHWNVANSILLNRFVQNVPLSVSLVLIVVMGVVAALVTWKLRAVPALLIVGLVAVAYIFFATALFVLTRYSVPLALPVIGALMANHICLVTWKVVFEQADKRRVAAVLSTIVSPKIARELLQAKKLSLAGARREITVLFADVRGFTELTDSTQEHAEETVRKRGLSPTEAEAYLDEQARHTLNTVNRYLGTVADVIVNHDGTLDKFIGDCVMAFWGAPTATPRHAMACVRAAIESQRAVQRLNLERTEANRGLEIENRARISAGLPPKSLFPILHLGTGVNTGMASVGLMGSEVQTVVRQGNYTVFGREVNLASRLETLSGTSRIYISQSTYNHLRRDAPDLADSCVPLPPVTVKGIRTPVVVYEVPWDTVPPITSVDPAKTT